LLEAQGADGGAGRRLQELRRRLRTFGPSSCAKALECKPRQRRTG